MLELKKIKKIYSTGSFTQVAVNDISLKFREKEFVSILGPSGSGKTTLLNIIGGLDHYTSGDLIIDGVSTKKYSDHDFDNYRNKKIGFVFQNYNLITHQSILSNVELALTLSGISKKERRKRAIEALVKVGLKDHIHKLPTELSGGQMQRVAIARAIVNNPKIILADEPTGALDSKTSVLIMNILKEISNDRLVIMVTHNETLAKEYSTRIINLKDGVVINDSNSYDETEEVEKTKTRRLKSMSLFTALSLSFNNLLTKKWRTLLTAFAGSIGIIGIALILSLSNGVSNYISNIQKETLSNYPISISRNEVDFGAIVEDTFKECEEGKICLNDITNFDSSILYKKNDLNTFKKKLDNNYQNINQYINYIDYKYNIKLNMYSLDLKYKYLESDMISNLEAAKESYELLDGRLAENEDEIVLLVDNYRKINKDIVNLLNIDGNIFNYNDFINKEVGVILPNNLYYKENGVWKYNDPKSIDKKLKVVGVIKSKNNTNNSSGILYTNKLLLSLIEEASNSSIVKEQIDSKKINILTNREFINEIEYNEALSNLGYASIDKPDEIELYPKDYDSRQKVFDVINKYNEEFSDNKISYTDTLGLFMDQLTSIVNIITYALIFFVAISLVVSSIMISIITYISVLERTKEIGILRAIGASKKDIRRVFNAETIIEGFTSGVMGIAITLLINQIINAILYRIIDISNLASLPLTGGITLIFISIILTLIAGLIPSHMASKKDPVESLRSE